MKPWPFLMFLALLFALPALGQESVVRGLVVETASETPVRGAVVTIRNAKNIILYNTQTSAKGEFSLMVRREKVASATLVVSSMTHQTTQCPLTNQAFYRVEMQPKAFEIKDVYVKPDKITHRNDTTSYLVSAFATQKDRTIGDVLRNLPGINVSKEGLVSYNGKAIDQFLIEGVDLFDGQYNIATRNISHDVISRVDVVENFQPKKTMRKSKAEGLTALNLALKDKAKGRWSGNVRAATGLPKLWEGEAFGARLSAVNQTSVTAKSNNTGKDIMSENKVLTIDELLKQVSTSNPNAFMSTSLGRPGALDKSRTRFGRTHIANIGNVQKVSASAIVRTKLYYSDERNTSERQHGLSYFLADTTLTRATTERGILNNRELSAAVMFKSDKERSFFSNEIKYGSTWQRNRTLTQGDDNNQSETRSDMHTIENQLQWIRAIGKHHVKLTSVNLYRFIPEQLTVVADSTRQQDVKRRQFLSSTQLNFTFNTRRWAFEMDAEGRVQVMNTESNYRTMPYDTAFYECANINYMAFIVRPTITYKHRGLRGTLKMSLNACHYFGTAVANKLFPSPTLSLSWELNSRWKLGANVAMNSHEPSVNDSHAMPMLVDYRTFMVSPISFYGSRSWQEMAFVSYTDYMHMLFVRASVAFNTRHNNLLRTKQVDKLGMAYYSMVENDNHSHGTMAMATMSKRLEWLKGTFNVECMLSQNTNSMYQNGVNTQFKSGSLQTSASLNSNVWAWLDVAYRAQYNINSLEIGAMKTRTKLFTQELELTLMPTDALNFSFSTEHYANFFNDGTRKQTLFADFNCLYKYRKTDFTLYINNILNQRYYNNTTYNNLSSTYNQYALRGRTLLVGMKVYF
ncbi:MAG: carboxypeptidase regulatory-like domain-containing protein [Prevotella sp.]